MVEIILLLFKIINKFSKGCCGKKKKKGNASKKYKYCFNCW